LGGTASSPYGLLTWSRAKHFWARKSPENACSGCRFCLFNCTNLHSQNHNWFGGRPYCRQKTDRKLKATQMSSLIPFFVNVNQYLLLLLTNLSIYYVIALYVLDVFVKAVCKSCHRFYIVLLDTLAIKCKREVPVKQIILVIAFCGCVLETVAATFHKTVLTVVVVLELPNSIMLYDVYESCTRKTSYSSAFLCSCPNWLCYGSCLSVQFSVQEVKDQGQRWQL